MESQSSSPLPISSMCTPSSVRVRSRRRQRRLKDDLATPNTVKREDTEPSSSFAEQDAGVVEESLGAASGQMNDALDDWGQLRDVLTPKSDRDEALPLEEQAVAARDRDDSCEELLSSPRLLDGASELMEEKPALLFGTPLSTANSDDGFFDAVVFPIEEMSPGLGRELAHANLDACSPIQRVSDGDVASSKSNSTGEESEEVEILSVDRVVVVDDGSSDAVDLRNLVSQIAEESNDGRESTPSSPVRRVGNFSVDGEKEPDADESEDVIVKPVCRRLLVLDDSNESVGLPEEEEDGTALGTVQVASPSDDVHGSSVEASGSSLEAEEESTVGNSSASDRYDLDDSFIASESEGEENGFHSVNGLDSDFEPNRSSEDDEDDLSVSFVDSESAEQNTLLLDSSSSRERGSKKSDHVSVFDLTGEEDGCSSEEKTPDAKGQPETPIRTPITQTPDPLSCPRSRRTTLLPARRAFRSQRSELTNSWYRQFNERVFGSNLPEDLSIEWSKRLVRTAGVTNVSRKQGKDPSNGLTQQVRVARISLSEKVVDSENRLKQTLLHEMCHAAAWLVDNKIRPPHGQHFWKWANISMKAFPDIPVSTCHTYEITFKFVYECTSCGARIGRHSKSVDIRKQVCGTCKGRLILAEKYRADGTLVHKENLVRSPADFSRPGAFVSGSNRGALSTVQNSRGVDAPRTPNAFARFVKEHYGSTKKNLNLAKHGDVMKVLSRKWKEDKIAATTA